MTNSKMTKKNAETILIDVAKCLLSDTTDCNCCSLKKKPCLKTSREAIKVLDKLKAEEAQND